MDTANKKNNNCLYHFIKRFFDVVVSFFSLIILSPILIIVAFVVICTSKGGAFYVDRRYGKNKKEIKIIKFRSMKKDARPIDEILTAEEYKEFIKNYKLDDDPRITKFGRFMRKTSIDELPQLINILIGDMSFVGPRPIVKNEYKLLWGDNDFIFSVRPGLTGYWAVNGRSDTSYDDRIELERYYVMNCSLKLDIKIFFKTILVAIKGKGAI